MLVLSRKQHQNLLIGTGINVRVLSVHGKSVKLGIEAPGGVIVRRGELASREDMDGAAQGEKAV